MLDAKPGRGKHYVRVESKISRRCGFEIDEVLEERRVRQDGGANKLKEQLAPFAIFSNVFCTTNFSLPPPPPPPTGHFPSL